MGRTGRNEYQPGPEGGQWRRGTVFILVFVYISVDLAAVPLVPPAGIYYRYVIMYFGTYEQMGTVLIVRAYYRWLRVRYGCTVR